MQRKYNEHAGRLSGVTGGFPGSTGRMQTGCTGMIRGYPRIQARCAVPSAQRIGEARRVESTGNTWAHDARCVLSGDTALLARLLLPAHPFNPVFLRVICGSFILPRPSPAGPCCLRTTKRTPCGVRSARKSGYTPGSVVGDHLSHSGPGCAPLLPPASARRTQVGDASYPPLTGPTWTCTVAEITRATEPSPARLRLSRSLRLLATHRVAVAIVGSRRQGLHPAPTSARYGSC